LDWQISGFAATIEVETRAEGEEMSASRQATRRWSSDEERKLDELLDAGKEATEIAAALNRSRQAVYARLQRLYRKRARL
jgi:DNA-binding NarL/FixJ family response regulator